MVHAGPTEKGVSSRAQNTRTSSRQMAQCSINGNGNACNGNSNGDKSGNGTPPQQPHHQCKVVTGNQDVPLQERSRGVLRSQSKWQLRRLTTSSFQRSPSRFRGKFQFLRTSCQRSVSQPTTRPKPGVACYVLCCLRVVNDELDDAKVVILVASQWRLMLAHLCHGGVTKCAHNGARTQREKGITDFAELFQSDTLMSSAKKPQLATLLCESSGAVVEQLRSAFNIDLSLFAHVVGDPALQVHSSAVQFPWRHL